MPTVTNVNTVRGRSEVAYKCTKRKVFCHDVLLTFHQSPFQFRKRLNNGGIVDKKRNNGINFPIDADVEWTN